MQPHSLNWKNGPDRSSEITRENQKLYEKLLNISERKNSQPQKRINSMPKVANIKIKKIEADRIMQENKLLVEKLSSNYSELSCKKMIKDYETVSKYKNQISRTKFNERIKNAVKISKKTLPPILTNSGKVIKVSTTPVKSSKVKTLITKQQVSLNEKMNDSTLDKKID